jgi:hypothetical protein
MIITLYKDKFYDGLGRAVSIGAGDTLTRRLPDDNSYELNAMATVVKCAVCSGTGRVDPCVEWHPEISEPCEECNGTGVARASQEPARREAKA